MIKICNVLINNKFLTVIDYDGIKIQIPAINKDLDTVKVSFGNGRYKVVDDLIETDNEATEKITVKPKKRTNKKATKKEVIEIDEEDKSE